MKDFFTFYTDITEMAVPFQAFTLIHFLFIVGIGFGIYVLYNYYKRSEIRIQMKFQRGMAIYFLLEETLYTLWLLLNCHDHVWSQVLPLELCSLCVYINVASVLFKKDWLRFFSGVVGMVAGIVAMVYPANVMDIYPIVSYRVLNFYLLHGAFVLFSLIQLSDESLLAYHHIKKNTILVCTMFTVAYFVNLVFKTQYMFVGAPPKIGFIAAFYQLSGVLLFLPGVLLIVSLAQFVVVYILRKLYHVKNSSTMWSI